MARFRKKPVEVEAWCNNGRTYGDVYELASWCGGHAETGGQIVIPTLEGDMRADVGDWIIRGVKGEFYPCKPDIFDATYEPAPATPESPEP